jgi:hypothetical protein
MQIVEEAFKHLYPNKDFNYKVNLKYSAKFKPYNANVRYTSKKLEFSLSRKWKNVSKDIVMGLIQSLLLKVFKGSKDTIYIDLYNSFIKNLHITIPKDKTNPVLENSFNRINEIYFDNLLEIPNLEWGSFSRAKLGSYDYHTDTITISRIFNNAEPELIDYIMYHEMLHKKMKFRNNKNRSYHHTSEFRKKEKQFKNQKDMERKIAFLVKKSKTIKRPRFPFFI